MEQKKPLLDKLYVSIKSPEGKIYEGYVDSLSSTNEFGLFDILPEHSNFICIIRDFITLYDKQAKVRDIKIDSGVLRVSENKIKIFLGIDTLYKQKN